MCPHPQEHPILPPDRAADTPSQLPAWQARVESWHSVNVSEGIQASLPYTTSIFAAFESLKLFPSKLKKKTSKTIVVVRKNNLLGTGPLLSLHSILDRPVNSHAIKG